MKKSRVLHYLACFTIVLTLLSLLSGDSFAARDSSEHENDNPNQYMREDPHGSYMNGTDSINGASSTESDVKQEQKNLSSKNRNEISEHKQGIKQLQEELQFHKQEYRKAKEDFLKIRNSIQREELDLDSEEALNATKFYLNSSIEYMIAHLSYVKSNIEYSKGSGTEEKIVDIDKNIKLLEIERTNIAKASSHEELVVVVRSVREIWNNADKTSLSSAGETVSEKIGESLKKSENLSENLSIKVEDMKKTGVNTAELETELASYISYIKSAQEKKEAADSIYSSENTTREDLQKANNYLRQSLNDISKANKILRKMFGELKNYEIERDKGSEVNIT
jgi:hypothetical protein